MSGFHNYRKLTGGPGGDALLVWGEKKTALFDAGMAYCGPELVKNIKEMLKDRPLDYIFASHSHYDHIGGIPYLKAAWPKALTVGMEYTKNILSKETALAQIRHLALCAAEKYVGTRALPQEYDDAALAVDLVAGDGDSIDLGGTTVRVIHTPGHTKDTCSYYLEKEKLLFAGETLGLITIYPDMIPGYLISFQDTIDSIERCEKLGAKYVKSPHGSILEGEDVALYFNGGKACTIRCRDLICGGFDRGLRMEEIIEEYAKAFRDELVIAEQPEDAFVLNTQAVVKATLEEFGRYY